MIIVPGMMLVNEGCCVLVTSVTETWVTFLSVTNRAWVLDKIRKTEFLSWCHECEEGKYPFKLIVVP